MKSCPSCNRTYGDDTFTFCLDDGALLSASYDPGATLQIPAARDTDQQVTEILRPQSEPVHPHPAPPQATIRAPVPFHYAQETVPSPLHEKRGSAAKKFVGGVIVLLSIGVIVLGYIVWRGNQNSTSEVAKNNSDLQVNSGAEKRNVPTSNVPVNPVDEVPSTPKGSPTAQWLAGVWEGRGFQPSPKMTWTVRLTAENHRYVIEYPSLRCGGKWTLIEMGENKAKFREVIDRGLERCSSGGDILIERIGEDQISYTYTLPVVGEVATATLKKASVPRS